MKILVGFTGSVASILAPKIINELHHLGEVKSIATKNALHFMNLPLNLNDSINHIRIDSKTGKQIAYDVVADNSYIVPIYKNEDEWRWQKIGDTVEHIELRKWANVLVIAPLSANVLAKIVNGICDDLLTSVVRAWDWRMPVIVAPAMNTFMWDNPITAKQIKTIQEMGAIVVDPVEKLLACNDVGKGAMADIKNIVQATASSLQWSFPLKECSGIPVDNHPGSFGYNRKYSRHTGVDIYCKLYDPVYTVEKGTVEGIVDFTGTAAGCPWWHDTKAIVVRGASGLVIYGEISPLWSVHVGMKVNQGQMIGNVLKVLKDDQPKANVPGHSTCMLHMSFYKHFAKDVLEEWNLGEPQSPNRQDPTPFLLKALNGPGKILTEYEIKEY